MGFFSSFFEDEAFFKIDKIYTNNFVPGKEIEKSLGIVTYVKKGIKGDIINEIEVILRKFLRLAGEKGADAVINTRITTGSYHEQGSKWNVTYIIIYGEAVKFKS